MNFDLPEIRNETVFVENVTNGICFWKMQENNSLECGFKTRINKSESNLVCLKIHLSGKIPPVCIGVFV